ncbi:hypothetical protein J7E25_11815 [Agromyces sp. ISL-38]|uniref:hypothetical protein n=1 Tax=Agromyces sp. ISL-38 TaxID=2819107 RepID=UPI001BE52997|nr:hypothetical protein [Agromyces sp. ISL-38]MBT2499782.1 hypothetical protein [Agromyces sp. ISL-38]MBT2516070.1 hypothetical protein [Streptomyces sp. ISL-90]
MSVITLAPPREPFPIDLPGLLISPAGPELWRVAKPAGTVLGHIERRDSGGGVERYRARRLLPGGIRSMDLGEFWSPLDAAECFR